MHNKHYSWTFTLATIVVAGVVVAIVALQNGWLPATDDIKTQATDADPIDLIVTEGADSYRNDLLYSYRAITRGNYEAAIQRYREFVQTPEYDAYVPDAKAIEYLGVADAFFRVSGDRDDARDVIETYKQMATNQELSLRMRATFMNLVALSYDLYGRDNQLLDTIYSEEPFASYRVADDPNQSMRNIYQVSFELYPTPRAAIGVAQWYARELLHNDELSAVQRAEYTQRAQDFLSVADTVLAQELERVDKSKYILRGSYLGYRVRRAFVSGALAHEGVVAYRDYTTEYDRLIAFIKKQDNYHYTTIVLPLVYMHYATFTVEVSDDRAKARQLLKEAVRVTEADPLLYSNRFARYIANSMSQDTGDWEWEAVRTMQDVSTEFKAFATEITSQ